MFLGRATMKGAHKDPASTAVVIQPRHSLGGKQSSWNSTDDFTRKRMSSATPCDPLAPPQQQPQQQPPSSSSSNVPPLHPHHLSAIESARHLGSGGVLARGNSGAITNGSGSNPPASSVLGNPQDVLLKGVLMKRAPFFKHWLPRYFVLTKSSLLYYSKNPTQTSNGGTSADLGMVEKKLLRGEISRGDVIRVEATDAFKNHPFSFVIITRKRPRTRLGASTRNAFSCMFVHHKETRLVGKRGKKGNTRTASDSITTTSGGGSTTTDTADSDNTVMVYYIQASQQEDRKKWIKTLQRWIDGESPTKLGHAIFEYIVNNEYSHGKYDHKVGETLSGHHDHAWGYGGYGNGISPAAQAGRRVEEEHSVLANLIRDMHECHQEDEMIFILDQILGEIKDGACSGYVKKLVAAAGEIKLQSSPTVWTTHVKNAYANIMKALYTQKTATTTHQHHHGSASAPEPTSTRLHHPGAASSLLTAPSSSASTPFSTLRPTVLKPTRQTSDGGESAPEFSFHRSYKLGRKLGSGAYSVVHIATHRSTRKQVAVKCIAKFSMSKSDVVSLKHEVDIMRTLDHPNVVPLLDYYEEAKYYYIVTPLCTGGELFDALVKRKSYTEEDARVVMHKLVSAISYFHARGVVHRDLKPENILLKTSAPGAEVMIADFGFARSMRGEKRLTACGTPGYVAPEVVRGEAYGSEVDMWSLGVILYILLCGYPPFAGDNHAAIFEKVICAKYKFASPDWDEVSEDAKDLVRKLLTVDRSLRLTASEVLDHKWMKSGSLAKEEVVEGKPLVRISSDLLQVLNQMRKQKSLTHAVPKIRPSDMDVDVLELTRLSIDLDVDLLDRELANLDF